MENEKRQLFAKRIAKAFANISHPYHQVISSEKPFQEMFQRMRWQDISIESLHEIPQGLSMLAPGAFAHFLPAFLISIVLYPQKVEYLRESLVFYLLPYEDGDKRLSMIIEALTGKQRSVVYEFLKLFSELEPERAERYTRGRINTLEKGIIFWEAVSKI